MKIYTTHNVHNISYHVIWIPKYRKRILVGEVKQKLISLLKEIETKINIKIEVFEIMPDHIHLFLKGTLDKSIAEIMKYLKGYTSYMLRREFKFLSRYKSLWTHSYYCETIGHISEETVKKYIRDQTK